MRFLYLVILSVLTLSLSTVTHAADKAPQPKPEKTEDTSKPKSEVPQTKTNKPAKKVDDLDTFFKEAEEQMKDGPTCQKPSPPVA